MQLRQPVIRIVAVLPFFGAMLVVLLLLALVPGLVTWLPNLLLGP